MRVALGAAATSPPDDRAGRRSSRRARLSRSGALLVRDVGPAAPAARGGRPRRASGRARAGKRADQSAESRWRDVVGHRILSPALDGVLARRFARKAAVAVVLSERARSAWTDDAPPRIVVADHGADPPTPGRCRPSERASTHCSPGTSALARGSTRCSKLGAHCDAQPPTARDRGDEHRRHRGHRLREPPARALVPVAGASHMARLRGRSRVHRLVAEAAVVVAPYRRSNPASGVLVRAMVEGRAVVATRVPAALDCLEDGVSGLLVEPDDSRALAEALELRMRDPGAARSARSCGGEQRGSTIYMAALHRAAHRCVPHRGRPRRENRSRPQPWPGRSA